MNSIKNIIIDGNIHEIILENENKDIFKMH